MKIEKKHFKVILLVTIGLIAVIFLLLSRNSNEQKPYGNSEAPISKKDHDFSYDEVTRAYESANNNGRLNKTTNQVNPFLDHSASDSDNIFDLQGNDKFSKKTNTSDYSSQTYSEENDPKIQELQKQIELLERRNKGVNTQVTSTNNRVNNTPQRTREELELEYRQKLIQAKNLKKNQSQDYSATEIVKTVKETFSSSLEFKAEIYKDQFILPGDRVTMLLTEPITFKGSTFPKNTFIYGVANINGNRVLIDVTNINHIPVQLVAKDITDGNLGLYSKRAGDLWSEFKKDAEGNATNDLAQEISKNVKVPLVGNTIRAFSTFFKKQRYRKHDKIPLFDDNKLILTTQN